MKSLFTGAACLCATLVFNGIAEAQDQDLYIQGVVTDAVTGAQLAHATVDVFNEADTSFTYTSTSDLKGKYTVELYSWDSSYYVVSFNAAGHVTRRAVIDLTGMDAELDAETAWKITMNVGLMPEAGNKTDPASDDVLGYAVFDNKAKTIRWRTSPAKENFPVHKFRSPRLPSTGEKIAELHDKEGALVSGIVTDHWTARPLAGVAVVASTPGGYFDKVNTDQFGVYALVLPYDRVFDLRFEKKGLVTKRVEFDNQNIPEQERLVGFRANVDMRLFVPIKGEDFSFLEQPIGKASYDPETRNLAWDMEHVQVMQEKLRAILDKHPYGR